MDVLIQIVPPAFLSLYQKEIIKTDDMADILLIGEWLA